MGGKARATTGSTGYQLIYGLDIHNLKAEKLNYSGTYREPEEDAKWVAIRLGSLLGDTNAKNILFEYMAENGHLASEIVLYHRDGTKGRHYIRTMNTEYSVAKNRLFKRKFGSTKEEEIND